MTHVYTLKIRYSGEEDDVYVFSTIEKANAKVFEYFEEHVGEYELINPFQEYLFSNDIGYFDINLNRIL